MQEVEIQNVQNVVVTQYLAIDDKNNANEFVNIILQQQLFPDDTQSSSHPLCAAILLPCALHGFPELRYM